MSYRLRTSESIVKGLRRVARKQLRTAARQLDRPTPGTEAIHEARKSLKKTRTILGLIEEDDGQRIARDQKRLRKISRTLARLRDADAMVEVFEHLRRRAPHALSEPTFVRVRQRLTAEKDKLLLGATRNGTWASVSRALGKARRSAKHWDPAHRKFAVLAPGLERALRQGRKAMTRAEKSGRSEDFHEWRKQVKTLWYALRLLTALGKDVQSDIRALKRVETWLGEYHNVAVFCARWFDNASLFRSRDAVQRLRQASDEYQLDLKNKALALGRPVYERTPREYTRKLGALWNARHRRARTSNESKPRPPVKRH